MSFASVKADIDAILPKLKETKSPSGLEAWESIPGTVTKHGLSATAFWVPALPQIMEGMNDKSKDVVAAAKSAAAAILLNMSPYAIDAALPALLAGLSIKAKPAQKQATLETVTALAKASPEILGYAMVSLIGPIADLTCDIKKDVKAAAIECMTEVTRCTGNKDLEPFLPAVVEASSSLANTHKCVDALAGCVFVQNVETPALATMMPVLTRGLSDKAQHCKRTCCLIVDNMCKVVEDPAAVMPIMSRLEPLVIGAVNKIADPEARSIAERALATLKKLAEDAVVIKVDQDTALSLLQAALPSADDATSAAMDHVAACAATAANMRSFDKASWEKFVGFAAPFDGVIEDIRAKLEIANKPEEEIEDQDDEGVDLYKGNFSLAYGTLTLLRDTKLHLKRERFYGLLGPNQCGKTTLMRAIAKEQLEGFPKRDELKCIFVEHEIEEDEVDVQDDGFPIFSVDKPGWWWIVHTCNEVYKLEPPTNEDTVKELMKSVGFGYPGGPDRAANLANPVTSYSGGWKMKMQLCAAQLVNADVLMLDEPTGHLDVDNIKWLQDWLNSFTGSIICTSHFTSFLDAMCTHIIDFQDRKLKTFKGIKGSCLTTFVEKHPEKKKYFELSDEVMKFVFPAPGPLEGVKSRSKFILKMNNVTFQYPTKDKPTIYDVNLTVSQLSRVAVIGANGAGKSTAIKVLVGEAKPSEGSIWKAAGLRMAYVAQHAFHHVEKHLDKTACQYIMWRFAGNDDRESLEFKNQDLSVDEETARARKWCIDGTTGDVRPCVSAREDAKKAKIDEAGAVVPDSVLNRRQKKKEKTYDYEVKWQFKGIDATTWVEREILTRMGYIKLVQREDERQAAMAGLMTKQLTQVGVEKHLGDFGVDAESASHTQLGSLSGGMKVKCVLAAAMWQNPHIIILDEPTNYLDRDGLGALVLAIKDFKGGCLVISHNREFCEHVATEKWIMQGGKLRIEGDSLGEEDEDKSGNKGPQEVYDGAGNKIIVTKVLSAKELKKEIKLTEKKIKDGKKSNTLTEEDAWELTDKLTELLEKLQKAA